jgi:hypothetical protein
LCREKETSSGSVDTTKSGIRHDDRAIRHDEDKARCERRREAAEWQEDPLWEVAITAAENDPGSRNDVRSDRDRCGEDLVRNGEGVDQAARQGAQLLAEGVDLFADCSGFDRLQDAMLEQPPGLGFEVQAEVPASSPPLHHLHHCFTAVRFADPTREECQPSRRLRRTGLRGRRRGRLVDILK